MFVATLQFDSIDLKKKTVDEEKALRSLIYPIQKKKIDGNNNLHILDRSDCFLSGNSHHRRVCV